MLLDMSLNEVPKELPPGFFDISQLYAAQLQEIPGMLVFGEPRIRGVRIDLVKVFGELLMNLQERGCSYAVVLPDRDSIRIFGSVNEPLQRLPTVLANLTGTHPRTTKKGDPDFEGMVFGGHGIRSCRRTLAEFGGSLSYNALTGGQINAIVHIPNLEQHIIL
ncbi:hypothetical protein CO112_04205 [Candidatus Dojkabacteria bacterium CG_4_9_14_3_um_filter_150_Dojkabacteria_WS6_41_13]|uniref:Uncharacterized protein n=1 Tax=Candidatus Dojkabacteria bacterium CG_4_10_14_0_2_um_filter_Dojkabacteria_WS6_41_15 TaxID=2014249 RepID=A0A2M7W224_9BACT|nr:MAG: hypothetical protein COZ14_02115 [Candidatus Dojkabacteria bacterium CG_4_10_14_3_um_filter_Dojkabacteria_WS6_41_9]PJA14027.1 MAG: hypothetical protein COX64_02495 [Candidatus Dojkabacteria bacterium CG_4_10_14_0_2_um_filter_Dojkabacteria_WS6_41_15]PJB22464.1 MAG: hypothetical protein CO112_04205 [Candidatus Dojkabacteria bacterium CG_4_9_14_3_um_filter_150_Dojkabacteria_WS6_41_13]